MSPSPVTPAYARRLDVGRESKAKPPSQEELHIGRHRRSGSTVLGQEQLGEG